MVEANVLYAEVEVKDAAEQKEADPTVPDNPHQNNPIIDQSLALKMGLVSLARFGVLDDFLKWLRS